jgi:hypothetical protein
VGGNPDRKDVSQMFVQPFGPHVEDPGAITILLLRKK